ncbi:MAG: glyoxalase [SAR202 cluster bacterium Io17-Chloro-G6]|nr:MAG: glyoxalase [SAR202 cluster bacterium Io17-Chloro-G6]
MDKLNVRSISAVTLAVAEMSRSVDFYRNKVGLEILYGGDAASFSSFKVGEGYLNLILGSKGPVTWWGRLIFHVDDVDALYQRLVQAGLTPATEPADASWGERYFHIDDPDSHELSFAKPL